MAALKPFSLPDTGRSIWELAATLVPFFAVIVVMLIAVDRGYVSALVLSPLAGLLLLRAAREQGARVATLPENFAFMGVAEADKFAIADGQINAFDHLQRAKKLAHPSQLNCPHDASYFKLDDARPCRNRRWVSKNKTTIGSAVKSAPVIEIDHSRARSA